MSKKKPPFTRGYSESRKRLEKNAYYLRSCFNCAFYSQEMGDKEECCQNDNVLKYDMVVTDNNVYCAYWRQVAHSNENNLFNKKTGRSRLD